MKLVVTVILFGGISFLTLHTHAAGNLQTKSVVQNHDDDLDCAISEFNDRIQDRFKAVDRDFGYSRIMRPYAHSFRPENAREIKDVEGFTDSGQTVFLYLTDLNVLGRIKSNSTADKSSDALVNDYLMVNAIKGPALIAGDQKLDAKLPTIAQLWEPSGKALESFKHNESYDFTLNGWNISARPVRASQKSCLQCHMARVPTTLVLTNMDGTVVKTKTPEFKIGDPLGVVLYAYRNTKEK
jgi:hypothetical protein